MIGDLDIALFEKPGRRQIAAAMEVMERAFDPAFGEAWTAAQLAGLSGVPGCWLTLAQCGRATVGFAMVRSIFDESELLLLAVDPAWRRQAVGSALLGHAIETARARGISFMHLEVRASNSAIALYKKTGFEQVNTRPAYYRGNDGKLHDAYSFRMDLEIS